MHGFKRLCGTQVAQQAAEIAALEAQSREDATLRRKLHNTIQELKGTVCFQIIRNLETMHD